MDSDLTVQRLQEEHPKLLVWVQKYFHNRNTKYIWLNQVHSRIDTI